ncbi:hypothetical protein KNP414_02133 [Paenibacillus mucilaginosus KNP414]|uniref:Uncharacterized protein n=1 Tax=Paenibacillus mucilaginosus (strain KNP414) TaxID=1036673 RepID=F8F4W4_PAEMK|nr:hypothetical protein KNP414_02133 [Paenibacillus mucilaginosus KNP414]
MSVAYYKSILYFIIGGKMKLLDRELQWQKAVREKPVTAYLYLAITGQA